MNPCSDCGSPRRRGVEFYDLVELKPVGFPFGSDWTEVGLAFVPKRYIAHE